MYRIWGGGWFRFTCNNLKTRHATPGVASRKKRKPFFLSDATPGVAWHGVANCSSSWLAARDRHALLVVTIQSIHRRGQRRQSLVALAQLVWYGQCVRRICAPLSRRVQVAEAAAADEQLGCRMRQQARRDTLERCGCAAAARSLCGTPLGAGAFILTAFAQQYEGSSTCAWRSLYVHQFIACVRTG